MSSVVLELTKKQANKLSDVLWDTSDEGPEHEGWASDELSELRSIVDAAIKMSKK